MAAEIVCERVLEGGHSEHEVVAKFPKSLRTRCCELWMLFVGYVGVFVGYVGVLLLVILFLAIMIALCTEAYAWIPQIIYSCHRAPGIALTKFIALDIAKMQTMASTPDSPWRVRSAFNASFSTWNTNTLTKCFTTYRQMDVRVEYRGRVILQQLFPLGFSLNPHNRHSFSIEMKSDHGQLTKDWGAYMQSDLGSDNITFNLFYSTRYLIADRRSKWKHEGCIVVVSSRLKTALTQNCSFCN